MKLWKPCHVYWELSFNEVVKQNPKWIIKADLDVYQNMKLPSGYIYLPKCSTFRFSYTLQQALTAKFGNFLILHADQLGMNIRTKIYNWDSEGLRQQFQYVSRQNYNRC